VSVDCRDHQCIEPDGDGWGAPVGIKRQPGHTAASVGAWCSDVAEDTTVVLEGTVLHADAPNAAWTQLWTATLSDGAPTSTSGAEPIYIGCFRFLRWRLNTSSAPNPGSVVHLAFDGDLSE